MHLFFIFSNCYYSKCVSIPYDVERGEVMPDHKFTLGGSVVRGTRVAPNGAVIDFEGTLRNWYKDYAKASIAARRKYQDSTIQITEIVAEKHRYTVPVDKLLEIATEVKE